MTYAEGSCDCQASFDWCAKANSGLSRRPALDGLDHRMIHRITGTRIISVNQRLIHDLPTLSAEQH